jgi:AraC-like DNA-binding protein
LKSSRRHHGELGPFCTSDRSAGASCRTRPPAIAGLSVFHFAREFKHSAGVTPHYYLVRRRVERAQELLAGSDLSLSEIAFTTGFSDQSHFTRHFRHMIGMTPGQFRRSLG